ncbi:MAG: polysaccharide deacetylase family protein [Clostridiaceae bacterium]
MKDKIKLILTLLFLGIFIQISTVSASLASSTEGGVKIPVLMYHHIDDKVTNTMIVTPAKFKSDMLVLKKAGYATINFNDLTLALNGYRKLPARPIIITFDDGYYSNYKYAYPILRDLGMKAVINIVGWSVGRSKFIKNNNKFIPHFSWEEASEMIKSGVIEIQNHTYDLHSYEGKSAGYDKPCGVGLRPYTNEDYYEYRKRLVNDVIINNQEIYNHTGAVSTFVAYPYGAYTKVTEQALTEAGIDGTMTTKPAVRYYSGLKDLREIPRLTITMSQNGDNLIKAIESLPIDKVEKKK